MRDSGALTELLLTRLKKVEVPKNYASLRKSTYSRKPSEPRADRNRRKALLTRAAPIDRAPQFRTFRGWLCS